MKWIGQHIYDLVSRFRSDVYLEDLSTTTETNVLVVDSDGKVSKTTSITGDITGVTITTDSGGGSAASDTSGSADFSILGATGVGVTNSGTTITATAVPGEIDHDSLSNFVAAEHYRWDTDISSTATIHTNNITDLHGAGVDGSANQLLTDDGDGTITSEANLTFDGSTLSVEADSNTTANALFIDANALTTGSAIFLDVDDALDTGTNTRSLVKVDYDKSAQTGNGESNHTTALDINMADAATNTSLATVGMTGVQIDIASANATGTIKQKGLVINVGADGVGDTSGGAGGDTFGIEMEVKDGGKDIVMKSHADTGDYCSIATTTHGATTITTVDDDAEAANLDLTIDGKITMTPADITGDVFHLDADAAADNTVNIDAGILDIDVRGRTYLDAGGIVAVTTTGAASHISLVSSHTAGVAFHLDADADAGSIVQVDAGILDMNVTGNTQLNTSRLQLTNTTTSSASEGGKINLICDDGAAMGDDHQLGKLGFYGAEDGSNTTVQGAKIAAFADAAWSDTENGARLEFHTMDGNASLSKVLTLDSNKLATFEGNVDVNGGQLKLVANAADYATMAVVDTGDLAITTVGDGTTDSDITITADGALKLLSANIQNGRLHGITGGTGIPMGIHHYQFIGYHTGFSGSEEGYWAYPEDWGDTNSPFEISLSWDDTDIDSGSTGFGTSSVSQWFRA